MPKINHNKLQVMTKNKKREALEQIERVFANKRATLSFRFNEEIIEGENAVLKMMKGNNIMRNKNNI